MKFYVAQGETIMNRLKATIGNCLSNIIEKVNDFYVFRVLLPNDGEYRRISNDLNELFSNNNKNKRK